MVAGQLSPVQHTLLRRYLWRRLKPIPKKEDSHPIAEPAVTVPVLNALDWTSVVLLIIGGINWGLIGLFGFNLVGAIFGEMSALSRIIYIVVGLAALYSIYTSSKMSAARRTA
jgi:uncharacterized membrane protein YuzA (DUF378 family)